MMIRCATVAPCALLLAAASLLLACSQAPAPPPPQAPAAPVASTQEGSAPALSATEKVYVCPMSGCNEVKTAAGKCSKCGMDLVAHNRADLSWICPMKECDEMRAEPGKCSRCGMDLVLKVQTPEATKR